MIRRVSLAMAVAAALAAGAAQAQTVRLMTGPQGGVGCRWAAPSRNVGEGGGCRCRRARRRHRQRRGVDGARPTSASAIRISTVDGVAGRAPFRTS